MFHLPGGITVPNYFFPRYRWPPHHLCVKAYVLCELTRPLLSVDSSHIRLFRLCTITRKQVGCATVLRISTSCHPELLFTHGMWRTHSSVRYLVPMPIKTSVVQHIYTYPQSALYTTTKLATNITWILYNTNVLHGRNVLDVSKLLVHEFIWRLHIWQSCVHTVNLWTFFPVKQFCTHFLWKLPPTKRVFYCMAVWTEGRY